MNMSNLLQLHNLTVNLTDNNHNRLNHSHINLELILYNLKWLKELVLNNHHKLFSNKYMDVHLFNNKILNSNNLIKDLCRNNCNNKGNSNNISNIDNQNIHKD